MKRRNVNIGSYAGGRIGERMGDKMDLQKYLEIYSKPNRRKGERYWAIQKFIDKYSFMMDDEYMAKIKEVQKSFWTPWVALEKERRLGASRKIRPEN